jgi:hypothetical protein
MVDKMPRLEQNILELKVNIVSIIGKHAAATTEISDKFCAIEATLGELNSAIQKSSNCEKQTVPSTTNAKQARRSWSPPHDFPLLSSTGSENSNTVQEGVGGGPWIPARSRRQRRREWRERNEATEQMTTKNKTSGEVVNLSVSSPEEPPQIPLDLKRKRPPVVVYEPEANHLIIGDSIVKYVSNYSYEVNVICFPGATMGYIGKVLRDDTAMHSMISNSDTITLHAGTNNLSRGNSVGRLLAQLKYVKSLIRQINKDAVVQVSAVLVRKDMAQAQIIEVNATICEFCRENDLLFVDCNLEFNVFDNLAHDVLHLNFAGAEQMTAALHGDFWSGNKQRPLSFGYR